MNDVLPLSDVKVLDLAFGHAAGLTAKFLADCGAEVARLEPVAGDPFYTIIPAYAAWRSRLAKVSSFSPERLARLWADADIVLTGGETAEGLDVPDLSGFPHNPRAIHVDIKPCLSSDGLDEPWTQDFLIQAVTGMMHESRSEAPAVMSYSLSGLGGCLQAMFAIGTALYVRETQERTLSISVGLAESALMTFSPLWSYADDEPLWFSYNVPRDAKPIIAECRDGRSIHVVLGAVGTKYRLYKLLGIDEDLDPSDPGLPSPLLPPDQYFGDIPLISGRIAKWDSEALLAALGREEIVAGPVLDIEEAWQLPQLRHNRAILESDGGYTQPGLLIAFKAADGSQMPAFDPMMQALSGLERRAGGKGNLPALTRTMPVDQVGGSLGQIGILLALFHRARTGRGLAIEAPLLNASLFLLADVMRTPSGTVVGPRQLMADRRGYCAREHVYRTLDGWIAISARGEGEAARLSALFDLQGPLDWHEQTVMLIETKTQALPTRQLLEMLRDADIPAAEPQDVGGHPMIESEDRLKQGLVYRGDRENLSNIRGIACGFRFDGIDLPATAHVPVVGEARARLVNELGATA